MALTFAINQFKKIRRSGYLLYGASTVFGRGLEYVMLILAAALCTPEAYGEFEFFKKVIEFSSILVAFGTPTLLLTYTKGEFSRVNLTAVSLFFSIFITAILFPIYYIFHVEHLVLPTLFFATLYYSGSIIQSFFVVSKGSNYSAWYKIAGSTVFNGILIFYLWSYNASSNAIVVVSNICLVVFGFFVIGIFRSYYLKGMLRHIKRYIKLFYNILYGSFSMVMNNFINIAFIYTDIFIIKYLSETDQANVLIGQYSFPLNIANALVIIPITIAHVDIEAIKKNVALFKKVVERNRLGLLVGLIGLPFVYAIVLWITDDKYAGTWLLFIILVLAKFVQSLSIPYGMMVVLKKEFTFNLKLNLTSLILNISLSVILYPWFGIVGVAFASFSALFIRYFVIRRKVKKLLLQSK